MSPSTCVSTSGMYPNNRANDFDKIKKMPKQVFLNENLHWLDCLIYGLLCNVKYVMKSKYTIKRITNFN